MLGMLFKTFSAAVFGIDAYLVEVEVDVGPGRGGDFNVVGLPDIAVKESRERIKSALRNCGFDFPSYQAVTVNLAPADIRKEGSAFDLPMALGLLGCQGTFFGKLLDSYVFLGELSLDGSVRSVRGALSAALAARERGIRNVVVPEANAKEAAVVEGIEVFAVKSLPQAADMINAPESFRSVAVDAPKMLEEASQYAVDLRDVRGQMSAKRALEVCLRGKPQYFADRSAGRREDDAREAHSHDFAADVARRSHRNDAHSQRCRAAGRCARAGGHAAVSFAAPYHQRCRAYRRRRRAAAGRSVAGAQWRSVSRRAAGIPAQRARSDAPASRRRLRHHRARRAFAQLSFALHARRGYESLSV